MINLIDTIIPEVIPTQAHDGDLPVTDVYSWGIAADGDTDFNGALDHLYLFKRNIAPILNTLKIENGSLDNLLGVYHLKLHKY